MLPLVVPLAEVPDHVVQSEPIGLEFATDVRAVPRVEAIPGDLLESWIDETAGRVIVLRDVTGVERGPSPSAGRVLGLRTRGQTIAFALVDGLVWVGDARAGE